MRFVSAAVAEGWLYRSVSCCAVIAGAAVVSWAAFVEFDVNAGELLNAGFEVAMRLI
jgi:hypothetical protein